jgi:hypothetical protein
VVYGHWADHRSSVFAPLLVCQIPNQPRPKGAVSTATPSFLQAGRLKKTNGEVRRTTRMWMGGGGRKVQRLSCSAGGECYGDTREARFVEPPLCGWIGRNA